MASESAQDGQDRDAHAESAGIAGLPEHAEAAAETVQPPGLRQVP